MANKEWIAGASIGLLSGVGLQKIRQEPSVWKIKFDRKRAHFYQSGKAEYEKIQEAKASLINEAQKRKGNDQMTNQQQTNQNQKQNKSSKLPIAIITGAVIGGAFVLLKDPEERRRLKDSSCSKKDSISSYASEVKEDPSGTKDSLVSKVRNVVSIANEALSTVQQVYNEQGKEITGKVKDIKEESEEIVETAKEAGDELQDVGDKAKEAKEELSDSTEDKSADEKNVEVNPRV